MCIYIVDFHVSMSFSFIFGMMLERFCYFHIYDQETFPKSPQRQYYNFLDIRIYKYVI